MKHIVLYFDEIDCIACSKKVENILNDSEQLSNVNLDYLNKEINLDYDNLNEEELLELVNKLAKKVEPDVNIYLNKETKEKITLYFDEIDCIACSQKVEKILNDNPFLDKVVINYLEKEILVEYHSLSTNELLELVNKEAKKEEPDINIFLNKTKEKKKIKLGRINIFYIIGFVLSLVAFILQLTIKDDYKLAYIIPYILGYSFLAYKIIIKAFKNILHGNVFDENFLMFIASFGAIVLSLLVETKVINGEIEFLEGVLVILLYNIGEYFQDLALDNSKDSISKLTKLKVEKSTLEDGSVVLTKDVKVGERIIVKAGERVPLDGKIVKGSSSFDTKALTGESLPLDLEEGSEVLAGYVNLSKVITILVEKPDSESSAAKIEKMIKEASLKKSRTEAFITKFASIYTPIVIILAIVVFVVEYFFIPKFDLSASLNNAFVFLVSSCPCALVISIPLSFFGGIGRCSAFGILVRGGNYLEVLAKVKHISFDKTGTLTKGNFKIKEINAVNGDEEELIRLISSLEAYSFHPIAQAICEVGKKEYQYDITEVEEIPGCGLKGLYQGKVILCGNEKLLQKYDIEYEKEECPGSVVYCSLDGIYQGNVLIVDEIKENSKEVIANLHKQGIRSYMLTGDKADIGEQVGTNLGIDEVYTELLPDQKLRILENIIENKGKNERVAYIGDGINDTPCLKMADVGIAMGGIGHDEASLASDIVLLNDDINNVSKAISISKFTIKILLENLIFALAIKFIVMFIGVIGILGTYGMFVGVFADVGVCLLCILNTLRILKYKE